MRSVLTSGPAIPPALERAAQTVEVNMKTQGEIEAAVCEGMSRFEQEYMGRGPKDIHAHLIGDLARGPPAGRFDRSRTATGQDAPRRKRAGPAQAGANAADGNGPAAPGSHDP